MNQPPNDLHVQAELISFDDGTPQRRAGAKSGRGARHRRQFDAAGQGDRGLNQLGATVFRAEGVSAMRGASVAGWIEQPDWKNNMFDLEVVCIASDDNKGTYRYTEVVANREIADSTANALVRRLADERMTSTHAVWTDGSSVGYAYTVPYGDIVGYANIREVVGEYDPEELRTA